ncbi:3-dehydroquinate synthase [Aquiluna sp. KACHI24]|uniref:3-dehydroquinate synthase n=1 Tax=Aquiluna sp. KACHI24 TaxID=2968831 RepID=UPI0022034CE8|nr:3-dehydroquinate synthase [Aquiluna sp. KACHI24]BDQ00306.1 3-dehydroquinate synthase [Aquiluna sp. KACHI24]
MRSVVGRGLLDEIPTALDGVKKVLIVHPQALSATAEAIRERLAVQGFEAILAEVPNGEDAKRIEVAAFCWGVMGQADFHRNDAVIGLGGGATTDLAGFVAATWLRGVRSVLIPTTLLGMVDAAVGGKTGVNTSEGKNLVGAFHLPHRVIIDLDTLETLPKNDLIAGMAEVAKYGFISDPWILDALEDPSALDPKSDLIEELVKRSVAIKERVTEADFKELGEREYLNYGHTLGHAIEHAERYKWRHGAAISIGMVFAAELSMLSGKLSEADLERHRKVLGGLGLPLSYRADRWDQLLATMQRDKKVRSGALRFVVLDQIGKPSILSAPTPELLFTAFQAIVE